MKRRGGVESGVLLSALVIVAALSMTACKQQETSQTQTAAGMEPVRVTAEQVKAWMDAGKPLTILDSRSAAAWSSATSKAVGAIRVPPDDVEPYLDQIPRDRTIIVYCT
jgi:uncharacterized lipoprotein YajG